MKRRLLALVAVIGLFIFWTPISDSIRSWGYRSGLDTHTTNIRKFEGELSGSLSMPRRDQFPDGASGEAAFQDAARKVLEQGRNHIALVTEEKMKPLSELARNPPPAPPQQPPTYNPPLPAQPTPAQPARPRISGMAATKDCNEQKYFAARPNGPPANITGHNQSSEDYKVMWVDTNGNRAEIPQPELHAGTRNRFLASVNHTLAVVKVSNGTCKWLLPITSGGELAFTIHP